MGVERIDACFAALKAEGRAAFVPFITACDPNPDISLELLTKLADNGGDIIELGMPFSDPMADGPSVQASSLRALKAGGSVKRTLEMVRAFRRSNQTTPIILMGYFNPILAYGPEKFAQDCSTAGVDGLIMVDLPFEEDPDFKPFADQANLALIRFVAPTTDQKRLPQTLANASGYIYFISITGVTGTKTIDIDAIKPHLARTKAVSDLPIAVGFGIKTPKDAAAVAEAAEAVVVGSAIVDTVRDNIDEDGTLKPTLVDDVISLGKSLSDAVRSVKRV